jgi:hypothetical protein
MPSSMALMLAQAYVTHLVELMTDILRGERLDGSTSIPVARAFHSKGVRSVMSGPPTRGKPRPMGDLWEPESWAYCVRAVLTVNSGAG